MAPLRATVAGSTLQQSRTRPKNRDKPPAFIVSHLVARQRHFLIKLLTQRQRFVKFKTRRTGNGARLTTKKRKLL
jgi:hypothetical protein